MKYRVDVWKNGEPCSTYRDDEMQYLVKVCKEDWSEEFANGRFEFYVYEDDVELSDEEERTLRFYKLMED